MEFWLLVTGYQVNGGHSCSHVQSLKEALMDLTLVQSKEQDMVRSDYLVTNMVKLVVVYL